MKEKEDPFSPGIADKERGKGLEPARLEPRELQLPGVWQILLWVPRKQK